MYEIDAFFLSPPSLLKINEALLPVLLFLLLMNKPSAVVELSDVNFWCINPLESMRSLSVLFVPNRRRLLPLASSP